MLFLSVLSLLAQAQSSAPEVGQFVRFRGARQGSMLSVAPVDGAEFIPKQHFDVSIELHKEGTDSEFPSLDEIKATINGKPLEEVLGKSYSPVDTWSFSYAKDTASKEAGIETDVAVSRLSLRSGVLTAPGTYQVEITIGSETAQAEWVVREPAERQVKNMVLLIGDGMAPSMIAAARSISKETKFGKYGSNMLNMEKLGTVGKVFTSGVDSVITDSANSAASYASGQKGWSGSLNVYADTSSASLDDPKVETLAEYIRNNRPEMCIGIVSTAEVQDATPAAFYSHTRRRGDKDEITDQMINGFTFNNMTWDSKPVNADVLLGGGGAYYCSKTTGGSCRSKGDADYYAEYAKAGYTVVKSKAELEAAGNDGPLLGIFHRGNMQTWLDRNVYTNNFRDGDGPDAVEGQIPDDQPDLTLMVEKAIDVMSAKCSDGFFLMAEAASVDKQMHGIDYDRALGDLLELDRTVKYVNEWAARNKASGETGIVVTADHAQAFDVVGTVDTQYFNDLPEDDPQGKLQFEKRKALKIYEQAGWPSSVIDESGMPTKWEGRYRLLSGKVDATEHREDFQVNQSPVRVSVRDETKDFGGRVYVANPDLKGIYYSPTSAAGASSTVHSLQDVDVYCGGPAVFKAQCGKVMDNTELFFILANGLGLGN